MGVVNSDDCAEVVAVGGAECGTDGEVPSDSFESAESLSERRDVASEAVGRALLDCQRRCEAEFEFPERRVACELVDALYVWVELAGQLLCVRAAHPVDEVILDRFGLIPDWCEVAVVTLHLVRGLSMKCG